MISYDVNEWVVLIVDDEIDNLGVAQKVLTFSGAEVQIARNGVEGLSRLEVLQPTFVLLDLSMPEMDGWEMFRLARERHEFDHIPIIALTAHAMVGDRDRVMAAGFDGYISKPFRVHNLLNEIQQCLDSFRENHV